MTEHSEDSMPIVRRIWHAIRCPHHKRYCRGRVCCCRDAHFHPLRVRRALAAVDSGSSEEDDRD